MGRMPVGPARAAADAAAGRRPKKRHGGDEEPSPPSPLPDPDAVVPAVPAAGESSPSGGEAEPATPAQVVRRVGGAPAGRRRGTLPGNLSMQEGTRKCVCA
ncbi:atherin-like isoform X1 [Panicum virgatum]|uniref:atherin-like isoform X1 n=1 Tax=Panicum virgatum TaxID=38727 RepID=UPI0019D69C83|nr:atherin-like isoform X1 [Panicum virgatum]